MEILQERRQSSSSLKDKLDFSGEKEEKEKREGAEEDISSFLSLSDSHWA